MAKSFSQVRPKHMMIYICRISRLHGRSFFARHHRWRRTRTCSREMRCTSRESSRCVSPATTDPPSTNPPRRAAVQPLHPRPDRPVRAWRDAAAARGAAGSHAPGLLQRDGAATQGGRGRDRRQGRYEECKLLLLPTNRVTGSPICLQHALLRLQGRVECCTAPLSSADTRPGGCQVCCPNPTLTALLSQHISRQRTWRGSWRRT